MAVEGNEYTQKAYERLVELSADEEKRMEYEARQKALRDYQHMMNSGWRQGVSDGREEGVKAIIEMLQELGMSREETQTKVHDKFSASEETVQEWLNKYWK